MASTPERRVKNSVVAILKQHGAYHFFPTTFGLGRSGVPDVIICHYGRFVAIECKAGKGTTTALQKRELQRISDAGGVSVVINETNIDVVRDILSSIKEEANETHRQDRAAAPTP